MPLSTGCVTMGGEPVVGIYYIYMHSCNVTAHKCLLRAVVIMSVYQLQLADFVIILLQIYVNEGCDNLSLYYGLVREKCVMYL